MVPCGNAIALVVLDKSSEDAGVKVPIPRFVEERTVFESVSDVESVAFDKTIDGIRAPDGVRKSILFVMSDVILATPETLFVVTTTGIFLPQTTTKFPLTVKTALIVTGPAIIPLNAVPI